MACDTFDFQQALRYYVLSMLDEIGRRHVDRENRVLVLAGPKETETNV